MLPVVFVLTLLHTFLKQSSYAILFVQKVWKQFHELEFPNSFQPFNSQDLIVNSPL